MVLLEAFAPISKVGNPALRHRSLMVAGTRARIARCWFYKADKPPRILHRERIDAMGFFSKDIKTMDDLFVHTLRDIYYAERQIVEALPDMIEKSNDSQLKQGF